MSFDAQTFVLWENINWEDFLSLRCIDLEGLAQRLEIHVQGRPLKNELRKLIIDVLVEETYVEDDWLGFWEHELTSSELEGEEKLDDGRPVRNAQGNRSEGTGNAQALEMLK
jgi:hypothetical protein